MAFCEISGVADALSNETAILSFCHLLEKYESTELLLEVIIDHLKTQGLLISKSTIKDYATVIHARSSTELYRYAKKILTNLDNPEPFS